MSGNCARCGHLAVRHNAETGCDPSTIKGAVWCDCPGYQTEAQREVLGALRASFIEHEWDQEADDSRAWWSMPRAVKRLLELYS